MIHACPPSVVPEPNVKWTFTLPSVFVLQAFKAILLLHALRQAVVAILIVLPLKSVTLFLAVVSPEENVSLFADQATVLKVLNVVPEITERFAPADIL